MQGGLGDMGFPWRFLQLFASHPLDSTIKVWGKEIGVQKQARSVVPGIAYNKPFWQYMQDAVAVQDCQIVQRNYAHRSCSSGSLPEVRPKDLLLGKADVANQVSGLLFWGPLCPSALTAPLCGSLASSGLCGANLICKVLNRSEFQGLTR